MAVVDCGAPDRGAAGQRVHDARDADPDASPADRRLVTQAEKLSRDGDHRGAAQAYEQAAAQAPGELRDRFLLRAAREYVRADQIDQAGALLKQVSTTLPSADFALRAAVAAEIDLQQQTSRKSIGRARSHSAAVAARRRFRPAGAARAGAVRDESSRRQASRRRWSASARWIARTTVRANRRLIWHGLQQSAAGNADFTAPAGRERDGHRLAGSRPRSADRRAQSVHRERRPRRLARPLSVASGEHAAERRRAARARRRARLSAADRPDPAVVGPAAGRRHRGARRISRGVAAAGAIASGR